MTGVNWWGATLTVEIAFGDDPLTALGSCTWTDVTADVRSFDINRGRQSELSTYSPGTATIVLDNRDRDYDPTNTAGPYYGDLLPMRRVRITAEIGATTEVIYVGYTLGWPLAYPDIVDATVAVQCVDALRILEQSPLPGSAYGAVVVADSPEYYWPFQSVDQGGYSPAAVGNDPIPAAGAYGGLEPVTNLTLPWGAENSAATGAGVRVDRAGTAPPLTLEAWVHNPGRTDGTGGQVIMLGQGASTSDHLQVIVTASAIYVRYSNTATTRRNLANNGTMTEYLTDKCADRSTHVAVTASGSTIYLYLDGQLETTMSTQANTRSFGIAQYIGVYFSSPNPGETPNLEPSISHFAAYTNALAASLIQDHYDAGKYAFGHPVGDRGGARIERVLDAIGWPAADRDLGTGDTVLAEWLPGESSALSACRTVEASEQGLLFVSRDGKVTFRDRQWQWANTRARTARATIGDGAGEVQYRDVTIDGAHIEHIRNLVTVSYSSNTASAKDQTSIDTYGVQSDSVSTALPSFGGYVAKQLAAYRLRLRKNPAVRVPSVAIDPRTDLSNNLAALIPLDLGDRVNVKRRPTGGTGTFSQDCTVQGIRYSVTPERMTCTLYLAPAPPSYTEGPYLTLGDSTYGKIGATAGNKVPY